MKLSKSIEGPNGIVTFTGELTSEELDLILSVGLNYLLQQGALPMKSMEESELHSFGPGSEELQ